jgi:SAM-dependent methyltransferase
MPLKSESFDLVISIGVLHHLPAPERALEGLAQFARPGGLVRVYLYWLPDRAWHRLLLSAVRAARHVTTRLPHRLLLALCYPLAVVLLLTFVAPYRLLRRSKLTRRLAEQLPLKAYADYPFGVLVNDQFDRLSAPIERRFRRDEVERMLTDAGLLDVSVYPHHGWVAEGRRAGEGP